MNLDTSLLRTDEKIIYSLRSLYNSYGYSKYKMSQFEEYDFYVKNKDFLLSDRIITFNDTNGKLMALKPDVTLSIIKSIKDEPGKVSKLYYNENVFRASDDSEGFKEIMQLGLECIGDLEMSNISEVITLAAESLRSISNDCILEISHLGIIGSVLDSLIVSDEAKSGIVRCINEKNTDTLESICKDENIPDEICNALKQFSFVYADADNAVAQLQSIISSSPILMNNKDLASALLDLKNTLTSLKDSKILEMLKVDLSIECDLKYYNGIVFSGFINKIPEVVLSGGQYNRLMKKMEKSSKAIGFAVYVDRLERLELIEESSQTETSGKEDDDYLNIALPKGRLGEKVYELFARAGYECPSILENNRKLIFENPEKKVRYFWAKPSDVSIYVERGAADIGVCGKDILLEYEPDIYELLDLKCGKCRMCVAAPKGFEDNKQRTLKVATKFSNIAKKYYSSLDRNIDIVHLNGSIEIAPILKLTDVIVDIVETGTTLKENNLEVVETVVPISARLISNKASYKFNSRAINEIQSKISEMIKEN